MQTVQQAHALSSERMDYNFSVTEQEANAILQAIQELPARIANPLTAKLQFQAKQQNEVAAGTTSQE